MRVYEASAAPRFKVVAGPAQELTRRQKFESLACMFERQESRLYQGIPSIEWTPGFLLRFRSTNCTVLAPVVKHLNEIGIPTQPNLASVMRSLELDHVQLHYFACSCNGPTAIAGSMAQKCRSYAAML